MQARVAAAEEMMTTAEVRAEVEERAKKEAEARAEKELSEKEKTIGKKQRLFRNCYYRYREGN